MKRSRIEINRNVAIQDLSRLYDLRPSWIVWKVIAGWDAETIEANLREWLIGHGCTLMGRIIVIEEEGKFRDGVYHAQETWRVLEKDLQLRADLSSLDDELKRKGLA